MNKRKLILISIIFLGFILRLWKINEIPPGLNRDEASIGYTSYSILKTGKDEYGALFPLSFKSFGDWKLPLYIYSDIFPVKLFGLSEISVRLPSVLVGTFALFIVYFLTKELLNDYKYSEQAGLLSSFLLAISPWHLHFSRVASEANFSVFLISLGLLLFFRGFRSLLLLFLSSIIFALSLYSYHSSHLFTPVLMLGCIFVLYLRKTSKKVIFLFILPFIFLSFIIYQKTIFSADKTKISGLSYFSDKYLVYEKISLSRLEHIYQSQLFSQVLHNKLTFAIGRFTENYLKSFSPEFLFLKGGGNLQHNIPNFGNLYVWELPFILFGMFFVFHKKIRWRYFLLFWFLLSPIPAAITRDAPHSARMLSILPLPQILGAFGLVEIIALFKDKRIKNYFLIIALFALQINFVLYLDRYFTHFPQAAEVYWGGGYKDLISKISKISGQYNEIVMDRPDYSPYIYFLFYKKIDPTDYQQKVVRYPVDAEGFQHVKSFGNLAFKRLDWPDDLLIPGRLLITWADSTPTLATAGGILVDKQILKRLKDAYKQDYGLNEGDIVEHKVIDTIKLQNGLSQFYLINITQIPKVEKQQ